MIRRLSEDLLLSPEDLKPLHSDFTVIGVFNPGAVKFNHDIVLIARVAEKPNENRPGFVGLPKYGPSGDVEVDWVPKEQLDLTDPRVARRKADSIIRLTSISHLRVFRSRADHSTDWIPGSTLLPESPQEEYGIEDPRITKIDETFWITYVAVSRHGAATSLASTSDFVTFKRHGVIFYPENKDVVLFPRKLQDQYVSLHRPTPSTHFSRPQIWLARSPDLLHWGQHECLHCGSAEWESDRVGAGTPPVEVKDGWLEIYHGSRRAARGGEIGTYAAGALLLDRDEPTRILRRSYEPIMQPTAEFERSGFIANVVFPTAIVELDETLRVYYGASDTFVGAVDFSRKELLATLR
ncbi:MAG: glycoside hydrolase family 130 protein [Pirellulales bacterium]